MKKNLYGKEKVDMKSLTFTERVKLHKIVKALVKHGFSQALRGTRHNYYEWCDSSAGFLFNASLEVTSGATRCVVLSNDSNWVLKFDFEEEDCGFHKYYNKIEAENFEEACRRGLDKYFAAMYYLGNLEGLEVYAQERVRADEKVVSNSFFEYTLENYYGSYEIDDEDVRDSAWSDSTDLENSERIYAMIQDSKAADALVDFTDEFDINDLHSGNWGYRGDEPVLIDYSGF